MFSSCINAFTNIQYECTAQTNPLLMYTNDLPEIHRVLFKLCCSPNTHKFAANAFLIRCGHGNCFHCLGLERR